MTDSTALEKAKRIWSQGRPIPMDLFALLAAEGLDVPALEDHYMYGNATNAKD